MELITKIKYPRTYHLPFSPGKSSDDKVLKSYDGFVGQTVIVTEKMDGENTTLGNGYMHARSLDSRHHPSRDWVKQFHGSISHLIPEGYRVCGENLYAKHSIGYSNLKSYFYGFSVWDINTCLDWETTQLWFDELGVVSVPVLIGPHTFNEKILERLADDIPGDCEGFVVRVVDSFDYSEFGSKVAKWVRKDHVQTESHWMFSEVVPNGFSGSKSL
jgi:hypothetical protein